MNTYKLKKVYPGLPKDWEIGIEVGLGCRTYGYSPCNGKYTNWYINNDIIENNPEFWEKVVEKDYEVLSYIKKDNSAITTKRENGFFLNSMFKDSHGVYSDYQLLNTWNIYSVKRLSDGEIFTIGDQVSYVDPSSYKYFIIFDIYITSDDRILLRSKGCQICEYLEKVKLIAKPLFKTEDDVNIFEHSVYHSVYLPTFEYVGRHIAEIPNNGKYTNRDTCKTFSTKEKAEEYVLMHKPCLSINDVLSVGQRVIVDEGKLKQIVKSKI